MAAATRAEWYGKHRAWADYVPDSHQPAHSGRLRDWIKQGRDHLTRTSPRAEERGGCMFLLAPPGDERLFCGVLGPSADGGKPPRQFPLAIYVPLERRRYRRVYPLLPAYAARAWEEMRAAQQRCLASGAAREVEEILAGLAPEIPSAGWGAWRRFRRDVSTVSAADFLATLHPQGAQAAVDLIARLAESLAPFRNGRLGEPELAFDIPASAVLKTAAYQAAFWLRLCESSLGELAGQPSLFLRPGAEGRRLSLFLREPAAADYALALVGEGDGERLHRLDAAETAIGEPIREAVRAAAREARSVADLFRCRWDRVLRETR